MKRGPRIDRGADDLNNQHTAYRSDEEDHACHLAHVHVRAVTHEHLDVEHVDNRTNEHFTCRHDFANEPDVIRDGYLEQHHDEFTYVRHDSWYANKHDVHFGLELIKRQRHGVGRRR